MSIDADALVTGLDENDLQALARRCIRGMGRMPQTTSQGVPKSIQYMLLALVRTSLENLDFAAFPWNQAEAETRKVKTLHEELKIIESELDRVAWKKH